MFRPPLSAISDRLHDGLMPRESAARTRENIPRFSPAGSRNVEVHCDLADVPERSCLRIETLDVACRRRYTGTRTASFPCLNGAALITARRQGPPHDGPTGRVRRMLDPMTTQAPRTFRCAGL